MDIHIPNSAFLGNIDGTFLRRFNPAEEGILHISANPKWIAIHPMALAMTAALGLTLPSSKIICETMKAKSAHYLVRMKLFDFLKIDCGITINEHDSSGRFIPLTQIKTSDELSRFLQEMVPLLHLEPDKAKPIKYIVSELVRNVLEHALSPHGAIVCAQYFEASNKIAIGIADTGVGIKSSMETSYKTADDLEAVRLALQPGITGTTTREGGTEQNAGAGLFFIKSIATVNRDFFMIYSGSAAYKLLRRRTEAVRLHADPFKDRHSAGTDFPYWKGTVVGIDISLDQTAEFSTLLGYISDTYSAAVKERRKARYKKANFI